VDVLKKLVADTDKLKSLSQKSEALHLTPVIPPASCRGFLDFKLTIAIFFHFAHG
jgi:hypothetical protein